MTTVLSKLNRVELKMELAEAVMNGDIVAAKIRLIFLEELISEQGFEGVDEIAEFYHIKHLVDAQYKEVM